MHSQEVAWLLQEKYGGQKSEAFLADCARLKAGEPLAYIIGWVPFLDCTIWLDSKPLIPRPETEFWVAHAIAHIKKNLPKVTREAEKNSSTKSENIRVLDLCAGSGCIGAAIGKALPQAHVDFAEIDTNHHKTILKNWHTNIHQTPPSPIDDRMRMFGGDLFTQIPYTQAYNIILSNPPYIDPALDRTESSVKLYEPHQALYGGADGVAIIENIIAAAPNHLLPGGELWIEHEPEQSTAIATMAERYHFTISTHVDQYQQQRYSVLVLQ